MHYEDRIKVMWNSLSSMIWNILCIYTAGETLQEEAGETPQEGAGDCGDLAGVRGDYGDLKGGATGDREIVETL